MLKYLFIIPYFLFFLSMITPSAYLTGRWGFAAGEQIGATIVLLGWSVKPFAWVVGMVGNALFLLSWPIVKRFSKDRGTLIFFCLIIICFTAMNYQWQKLLVHTGYYKVGVKTFVDRDDNIKLLAGYHYWKQAWLWLSGCCFISIFKAD